MTPEDQVRAMLKGSPEETRRAVALACEVLGEVTSCIKPAFLTLTVDGRPLRIEVYKDHFAARRAAEVEARRRLASTPS